MTDDARKTLQERFARVGAKALARLHEKRPDLQGKSLEQTVAILKDEERLARHPYRDKRRPYRDENIELDASPESERSSWTVEFDENIA